MKQYFDLGGAWQMRQVSTDEWHDALVPGSVYADLLRDGSMPDPFWRDNELIAFELMKHDWEYIRIFQADEQLLQCGHIILRCEGLDTLAHVSLNGKEIGIADNMHITWEWDVKRLLRAGENELTVRFDSPVNFCADAAANRPLGMEQSDAIPGMRFIRKAHCMFGWDWGPRLPDAGIWRSIGLVGWDQARLENVLIRQKHDNCAVTLTVAPEIEGIACWQAIVTAPDGTVFTTPVTNAAEESLTIESPKLWWPRSYGEQPLYTVEVRLITENAVIDRWTRRIGLRTLSISREKDEWGEEFCHIVNGVKIFAMGGNYIPEDNVFARIMPERTRRLLEDTALANFNLVRVWGGGYYPDDFFYDICDELGLLVWQDLAYACAVYDLTEDFERSIRLETEQNVKRLRHHASLALICGNNEIEGSVRWINYLLANDKARPKDRFQHVADYGKMFAFILPRIVKQYAPDTFWWPSSPSSGGDYDNPPDENRGDQHYWDVWHSQKPFTDYRNHFFRYASEFGFQSFPMLKTVESFTLPEDRNVFSPIMERHQRNATANGRILSYLSQTFRYPYDFDDLLYASQLMQAEAIRYGVEHWRRNRGRCMGAVIWQLNDCWPVASWSSIDYFGRWKALHYAAKRFFAPILISCEERGNLDQLASINAWHPEPLERSIRLNVCNETRQSVTGTVRWTLRTADAAVLREGSETVTTPALTALWLNKVDFDELDASTHYAAWNFTVDDKVIGEGTVLFCAPKHFRFVDPCLTAQTDGNTITLRASAYARQVWIESEDPDLLLSDNAFDMNAGEKTVTILRGSVEKLRIRSVYDLGH